MNTIDAIRSRRSIRHFKDKPVARERIKELIDITTQAPSGKNKQPWRFVVIEGDKKKELVSTLLKVGHYLNSQGINTGSLEWTAKSMSQAPVIIMIFNADSTPQQDHSGLNRYQWSVDTQSIGGAIQTMLLAATEMGLGTLWICDVFFADQEICELLGRKDELVAAVAVGYPDEEPSARPRKPWEEVTEWLS